MAGQTVVITTAYNGSLASGLARSSAFNYTDPATGVTQSETLIAANLEPVRARRMLPCFDAPKFKANFSINLQVPSDLIALSNTPEASSQQGLYQIPRCTAFRQRLIRWQPTSLGSQLVTWFPHQQSATAAPTSRSGLCQRWATNMLCPCRSAALGFACSGGALAHTSMCITGLILFLYQLPACWCKLLLAC